MKNCSFAESPIALVGFELLATYREETASPEVTAKAALNPRMASEGFLRSQPALQSNVFRYPRSWSMQARLGSLFCSAEWCFSRGCDPRGRLSALVPRGFSSGSFQEQTPLGLPVRQGSLRKKANKSLHLFRKQHFIRGSARRQRYLPKVENVEIFGFR